MTTTGTQTDPRCPACGSGGIYDPARAIWSCHGCFTHYDDAHIYIGTRTFPREG